MHDLITGRSDDAVHTTDTAPGQLLQDAAVVIKDQTLGPENVLLQFSLFHVFIKCVCRQTHYTGNNQKAVSCCTIFTVVYYYVCKNQMFPLLQIKASWVKSAQTKTETMVSLINSCLHVSPPHKNVSPPHKK